jgi:hypothetical protein
MQERRRRPIPSAATILPFRRPSSGQTLGTAAGPSATAGCIPASPLKGVSASPRLLDRVKAAIRVRHMSGRTEEAYVGWIRRFILFHGKRHPDDMAEPEVSGFLSALATERRVAASTQNQALAALLFLYHDVLGRDLDWLRDLVHAKRPERLPVVLTRAEVSCVLAKMKGVETILAASRWSFVRARATRTA